MSAAALGLAAACAQQPEEEAAPPAGNRFDVYFLAGQSNMEGFGFNADIPETVRDDGSKVWIFHGRMAEDDQTGGGEGSWAPLAPGHGTGFTVEGSSNVLSDRFGPELSFASAMVNDDSSANIAIIKYARGGTGLVHGVSGYGSWDPDYNDGTRLNQYDHALATIRAAMAVRDINGDGRPDTLVPAGIVWMQGETDAADNAAAAAAYQDNLGRMMDLFRAALHRDDLPVVIGQIADSGKTPETRVMQYFDEVVAAQAAFVEADPCAALVTVSEDFSFLPDGWHYQSADYLRLGEAFAEAARTLKAACGE